MKQRERVEAIFAGKLPDVMPWFGDLTYWYGAHEKIGDLPEQWQGERGIGKLHREFNVGEYVPGDIAYEVFYEGVEVIEEEKDGILTTLWHTPIGTLKEVQQYSPTSFSHGYTEHAVKSVDDLKVVRYISEHTRYKASYDKVAKLDSQLDGFGLPVMAVQGPPASEIYKHWAGLMTMTYLFADNRKEFDMTIDAIGQSQTEMYKITAMSPCKNVIITDNLSAETMGGYFDLYSKEYLTKRVELLPSTIKK